MSALNVIFHPSVFITLADYFMNQLHVHLFSSFTELKQDCRRETNLRSVGKSYVKRKEIERHLCGYYL
jgi:hypothetical protein